MKQLWKGAVLTAAIVLTGCAAEPVETELEIAQAAGAPFFEGAFASKIWNQYFNIELSVSQFVGQ